MFLMERNVENLHFQESTEYEVFPEDLGQMDIQGFQWNRPKGQRQKYRIKRLQDSSSTCKKPFNELQLGDEEFFSFKYTSRADICTKSTTKARKMIKCTGEETTYYCYKNKVRSFNPITMESQELFDASRFLEQDSCITCFDANEDFVVVAGGEGELIFATSDSMVQYTRRISNNSINCLNLSVCGKFGIFADNSDGLTRLAFDNLESSASSLKIFTDNSIVQNCIFHPSGDANVIFSHSKHQMYIHDFREGRKKDVLKSPRMKSVLLASDWHCSGDFLAVGQANFQTCLWDLKNFSTPLQELNSSLCEPLNCTFSMCGNFLAVGESDDFVNVFHLPSLRGCCCSLGERTFQSIDFIGEVAGLAFTPSGNSLFIGIGGDIAYSGLVEFERNNTSERLLECFI